MAIDADALIIKYREKSGLKGKITAKCIDCIYDPAGVGTWRQQVSACTSTDCSLYPVRPQSRGTSAD